jgi:hypothetical protein
MQMIPSRQICCDGVGVGAGADRWVAERRGVGGGRLVVSVWAGDDTGATGAGGAATGAAGLEGLPLRARFDVIADLPTFAVFSGVGVGVPVGTGVRLRLWLICVTDL